MPGPRCSDFWSKFGVFRSRAQNLEQNIELWIHYKLSFWILLFL